VEGASHRGELGTCPTPEKIFIFRGLEMLFPTFPRGQFDKSEGKTFESMQ